MIYEATLKTFLPSASSSCTRDEYVVALSTFVNENIEEASITTGTDGSDTAIITFKINDKTLTVPISCLWPASEDYITSTNNNSLIINTFENFEHISILSRTNSAYFFSIRGCLILGLNEDNSLIPYIARSTNAKYNVSPANGTYIYNNTNMLSSINDCLTRDGAISYNQYDVTKNIYISKGQIVSSGSWHTRNSVFYSTNHVVLSTNTFITDGNNFFMSIHPYFPIYIKTDGTKLTFL